MLRFNDIVEQVQGYNPKADVLTLQKAYVFSAKVHTGQQRQSGEPYLIHPLEVAGLLARMRLDVPSVATGLLHDTVEDTLATLDEIRGLFGDEVAELVDGVTKISKVRFRSKEERQAENFRKMLLATSKDIRIILIKLADRLHNIRTLEFVSDEKKRRVAEETMAIYAPIASRLGLQWIKTELEDRCFEVLQPEVYGELQQRVEERQKERQHAVRELCETVRTQLDRNGIAAEVSGRPKHFYSIYRKMVDKNLSFDEIYDVIAFRILVSNVRECYESLGLVHSLWKPLPGKVKDYIALPKANMYQSLHTAVIGPYGQPMEFQIRTREMHEVAEGGIAAHWRYKEGKLDVDSTAGEPYAWLRSMLAEKGAVSDAREFMDSVKIDLFPDEVYVFTPQGDVKVLPRGATPIDFAYAVHTEVGHTCVTAKVNGKIVPLNSELENGDIVAITTRSGQTPGRDWLKWVKTSKARQKIREHIRTLEHERSLTLGKELVEKELKRHGFALDQLGAKNGALEQAAQVHKQQSVERMFINVAVGTLSAQRVAESLVPEEKRRRKGREQETTLDKIMRRVRGDTPGKGEPIRVRGDRADVLVRFAKCCSPLPGDPIVGIITRGRGISVHRTDCRHTQEMIPERRIAVEWDRDSAASRPVTIEVASLDRPGLLANVSRSITTERANISSARVQTTVDEKAIATFDVHVRDAEHLRRIIKALERVKGVYSVARIDRAARA